METLKGPIFIITDDLALSEAIASLFQSAKVKSITYNGAIQGVSAFKTAVKTDSVPQFVLIDAGLKGECDGFRVSEEITGADFHDDSIRVLLTDKEIPFTKLLTASSGAAAVLRKNQFTGLGLLEELDVLARRKAERYADRTRVKGTDPNRRLLMIGFAVLLGALTLGLSLGYHFQSVYNAQRQQEMIDLRRDEDRRFEDLRHSSERETDAKLAELDSREKANENNLGLQKVYLQQLQLQFAQFQGKRGK